MFRPGPAIVVTRLLPPTPQSLCFAAQSFHQIPALPHWDPARRTVPPTRVHPRANSHVGVRESTLQQFVRTSWRVSDTRNAA